MNLEKINELKENINDFLKDFNVLRYSYGFRADFITGTLEVKYKDYKITIFEEKGNTYYTVLSFLYTNSFFYSDKKIEDIEVLFLYLEKELNSRGFYRKRNVILETKQNKKDNFILY
jgi:hypothetical protein